MPIDSKGPQSVRPGETDNAEDHPIGATLSLAEEAGVEPTPAEREPSQQSVRSILVKCISALVYVIIGSATSMLQFASKTPGRSEYPYNVGSLLLVQKILSIGLGLCLTSAGGHSLRRCFEWQSIRKLLGVALLFPVARVLETYAVADIGPLLNMLIIQSKLVTVAVASWLMLGRNYSSVQQTTLFTLMINVSIVVSERRDESYLSSSSWTLLRGILLCLLGAVLLPTFASVYQEIRMKHSSTSETRERLPFRSFQVQVSLPEALVSLAIYVASDGMEHRLSLDSFTFSGLFHGWNYITVLLLAAQVTQFWVSGYLVTVFDNVVRQVLTCLVVVVLYVYNVMLQEGYTFEVASMLPLLGVLAGSISWAISTKYTTNHEDLKTRYLDLEVGRGTSNSDN